MNVIKKMLFKPMVQKSWNRVVGLVAGASAHAMAMGTLVWVIDYMSKATTDPLLVNASERLSLLSALAPGTALFWSLMFVVMMCAALPLKIEMRQNYTRTKEWLDAFAQFPSWDRLMRKTPATLHNIERMGCGPIPQETRQQVCQELIEMHPHLGDLPPPKPTSKFIKFDASTYEYLTQMLMSYVGHSRLFTLIMMFTGLMSVPLIDDPNVVLKLLSFYAVGKIASRLFTPSFEDLNFSVKDLDDALAVAAEDQHVARHLFEQMRSDCPNPVALLDIKNQELLQEYRLIKDQSQPSHHDTVDIQQEQLVSVDPSVSQLWSADPSLIKIEKTHERF